MSELTDNELNALVAERMGYKILELPDGRLFWAKINEGGPELLEEVSQWNPCNRPEHWWRVVEWVRREDFFIQDALIKSLEARVPRFKFAPDEPVPKLNLWWFLIDCKRPGRVICEAVVEATE